MKIRVHRRLVGVLVAAALGALPFAIGGPALAAKPSGASFNPNLLLQGSSNTAEPSIRTDRFGHSFVIGPTGVPAGCKAWRVAHNGSSATYIGQPDHTAGGGDCDWAIGPQETSSTISPAPTDDDLAYSSLSLANITTGKSDDGGSTFETPDSATDNTNQAIAGTANYNRVYEAVGTVAVDTAPPVISWRNYEIYHGPLGARYNRIFPVTAVDNGGRVYAFWTDGNHIDYKADATGTGWRASKAPSQIANPSGVNTALMPWAQAGAPGIVDVVFYGASGGNGAQPNPQDDPNNSWNAYFAQTTNGGGSFTVTSASDHVIHKGPLCIDGLGCNLSNPMRDRTLLDFFQVSVDPTNGAADIAYADDHSAPGTAVVYFTRQCTGSSATTGSALVNDCVAPAAVPPPPQGSTCPGPQVLDYVGDAPNNYPGGDGSNIDNLDVVNAYFGTPSSSDLEVTLTIKDLAAPPPPANLVSAFWTVYWTYNGTTYFAQATSNGPVVTYSDGTFSGGNFNPTNAITGSFNPGPNGTIVFTVPRADVGSPANGATLTSPFADTRGSFTVMGTGVYYTSAADRAPDSGYGANYVVGQAC